jgi:hypothetical protein
MRTPLRAQAVNPAGPSSDTREFLSFGPASSRIARPASRLGILRPGPVLPGTHTHSPALRGVPSSPLDVAQPQLLQGGIIGCSCRCCIRFERDASSFLVSCDLMFCVLVFVYDACFYSTLKMVACCNCNPNNKCSSAISEIKTTNRIGGPKSLELCSVVAFFFFLERTAKSLIGIEKTEFQF